MLWATQLLAISFAGFDLTGDEPLSELANTATGWLFSVGLAGAAVLFLVFVGYLRRAFPVGMGFSVAMTVGMVGQLIAGLLPIGGGGWVSEVHVMSALILGASIPVLMWRFAADQPAGTLRRRFYGLFWLEAAACAAGIVLSRRHIAPVAEILPAMAFHLWVVVATVAAPQRARPHEAPGEDRARMQPQMVSRAARMSSP